MTLNLKMILELESRAARAELEAAVRGIKGVTIATSELTGKSKASAAATDTEASAKKRATAAARELAVAQRAEAAAAREAAAAAKKAAADVETAARKKVAAEAAAATAIARDLASAQGRAAAATGNLAAQFNDIGVMLAAGQNPLQLAIQQGTQISQAFGTAGAAGALTLLKQGFMAMISPVNLITIGAIAAGAAMFQWLTSSGEKAKDFATALGDADAAINEMRKATDVLAGASLGGLAEGYGRVNAQLQIHLEKLQKISQIEAMNTTRDSLSSVGNNFLGGLLTSDLDDMRVAFGTTNDEARVLMSMLDQIKSARTFEEQTAAVTAMRVEVESISGGLSNAEGGAQAFLSALIKAEDSAMHMKQAQVEVTAELDGSTAGAQRLAAAILSASNIDLSHVFTGSFGAADTLLGKVSAILAKAGAAATAMGQQANAAEQLRQLAIENAPGGQAMIAYGGRSSGGTTEQNALRTRNTPKTSASGGGGSGGGSRGGGGASAAKAEADSLQGLIDKLNGEITALKTEDPIQKEMLQYRKQLAGATAAERKQVEALILTREREKLAVEGMKAAKDFFEQTGLNALDALIEKGESLKDVLKGVEQAFLKAAIQGALFGQGPFGAMFGGKSILSGLFGGGGKGGGGFLATLFGGKADGGMIYGRGSGKSDSELRALSVGEFVVNARATARNRHLLEAINAGGAPGLASGGAVEGGRRAGSGRMGRDARGPVTVVVHVHGARGDKELREMAMQGTREAISDYDRGTLPTSMQRVSGDIRRIG